MQELFSKLEIEYPNLFNTNTLEGRKFINDYYKFFELEKNQIIKSHGNKTKKSGSISNYTYILTGEEYYNKQFKTK